MRVSLVRAVPVTLPSWPEFARMMEDEVEVGPEESSRLVGAEVVVTLPHAVRQDLERAALDTGWSMGQLISYFLLRGMAKVIQEAQEEGPRCAG